MSCENNDGSPDVDSVAKANVQPEASAIDGVTPTRLLKMKDIMENQCFEMNVKASTRAHVKNMQINTKEDIFKNVEQRKSYRFEMTRGSKYESEIEQARLSYFNKTLVLNRMQIWNAVIDKIIQNDADAESLKALTDENSELCEQTLKIIKETRELQDQITDIQKERLELKEQIKKKMQEINEWKQVKENQGQVHQRAKERAEAVLEKYQKVTTILQNVLRGIILASKVNWRDDPKLKDIAMGLENIPK